MIRVLDTALELLPSRFSLLNSSFNSHYLPFSADLNRVERSIIEVDSLERWHGIEPRHDRIAEFIDSYYLFFKKNLTISF